MWTIEIIKKEGFELLNQSKLWCHFRGHGYDVYINLDTNVVEGNLFNFHSYKGFNKGTFRARLEDVEALRFLLKVIV